MAGWIDRLDGGDGNDTLTTLDNNGDRFTGGNGDDTFKTSTPESYINGADAGPGNDTFDFSNHSAAITATAGAGQFPAAGQGHGHELGPIALGPLRADACGVE